MSIDIKRLKTYCCEDISLIENYELAINDTTQIWVCHHRNEINENTILSKQELIDKDLYWKRPASELILMPKSEHSSLHCKIIMKGRKKSEEHKKKLSEAKTGKKLGPWSDEQRRKLIGKRCGKNNPMYGKTTVTNGIEKIVVDTDKIPEGYTRVFSAKGVKRSEETKRKISEAKKKYWENLKSKT